MLRLALLATAIAYANAATSGTVITMYQIVDDANTGSSGDVETESNAACKEGGLTDTEGNATNGAVFDGHGTSGTSHIPDATNVGVGAWKMMIKDQCYNLDGTKLGMLAPFAAGEERAKIQQDSGSAPASVKFVQATTTLIPNLETYSAVDCATATTDSPQLPVAGTQGAAAGFQCGAGAAVATASALSTGYQSADNAASDNAFTSEGWRTANFIEIESDTTAVATAPALQACTTAVTTAGREWSALEVAADDNTAHPATDPILWSTLTAAACYSADNADKAAYTSYQTMCELETGDIVYSTYAAHANGYGCMGNGGAAGTSIRMNQGPDGGCTWVSNGLNWTYAAADVATLCATPANGAAAKWFTLFTGDAEETCDATYLGTTAAENEGTKAVLLGVCYTNAVGTGDMTGLSGPFSAAYAAGVADVIGMTPRTAKGVANAGGSYKFLEGTTDITLTHYTTPDCSGTGTLIAGDDPAGTTATADWACAGNGSTVKITHGGAATTGNIAVLNAATQYLTVRAHGDLTTGLLLNSSGNCGGIAGGLLPSGQRVDHFVLDQCFQNSETTSYKWKCENSGTAITNATDGDYYPISYEEFTDVACATHATASYMWFTQTSYNACADDTATSVACIVTDIDDSTEFAKQTMSCGACSTTTAKSEAACLALATPGTWTAGTCANVNGVPAEFGGKCVTKSVGGASTSVVRSYEILTNNATWNAICGVATPAPTTASTTTSGAGKIAATAAAAAAAAALLL